MLKQSVSPFFTVSIIQRLHGCAQIHKCRCVVTPDLLVGKAAVTPKQHNDKCRAFGALLLTVLAVAVSVTPYGAAIGTVGAAATATKTAVASGLSGALGATGGAIAAGAIAGATGSFASQGAGLAARI